MAEYRTSVLSVFDIKHHIVWMDHEILIQDTPWEVAERARDLLRQICQARDVVIIRGAVSPDHIQCWCRARRTRLRRKLRCSRHVGDFRNWKDPDSYQAAFKRVLRDLNAPARPEEQSGPARRQVRMVVSPSPRLYLRVRWRKGELNRWGSRRGSRSPDSRAVGAGCSPDCETQPTGASLAGHRCRGSDELRLGTRWRPLRCPWTSPSRIESPALPRLCHQENWNCWTRLRYRSISGRSSHFQSTKRVLIFALIYFRHQFCGGPTGLPDLATECGGDSL